MIAVHLCVGFVWRGLEEDWLSQLVGQRRLEGGRRRRKEEEGEESWRAVRLVYHILRGVQTRRR